MANIVGTPYNDRRDGTIDSDTLNGLGGNDSLYGNAGNDTYLFSAFDGEDYISDSAGIDRIVFDASVSRSDIRLATEDYGDLVVVNEDTGDELRLDGQFEGGPYRIERITFADGSSIDLTAPLTFTGDNNGNSIYATGGNDTLIGKGGNDSLRGGVGGDTYVFGRYDGAYDYIYDTGGQDGIRFEAGISFAGLTFSPNGDNDLLIKNPSTADVIEVEDQFIAGANRVETLSFADGSRYTWNGVEFIRGGGPTPGDDILVGTAGDDTIVALAGNDRIEGLGGLDRLYGSDGNDTVLGGDGDDRVFGEFGNDRVDGGAGNDRVSGGPGVDVRTGGTGNDVFTFIADDSRPGARDTITDFRRGDKVDVSQIDANAGLSGDQKFAFVGTGVPDAAGEIGFFKSGSNTIVRANTDSDSAIEFEVQLTGNVTLVSGDFIL